MMGIRKQPKFTGSLSKGNIEMSETESYND